MEIPKKMSTSLRQQLAVIKTKDKNLTEVDISYLRNRWFQKYKHRLGGMVQRLPPLREVNHKILQIDASKYYSYHLPRYADALKQQLSDKIRQYTDANWWVMKSVPQAAPMLCIPKKSGKLRTVIDCHKRNDNMVKDVTPFLDQDQIRMDVEVPLKNRFIERL
jgi:hypothetical protein